MRPRRRVAAIAAQRAACRPGWAVMTSKKKKETPKKKKKTLGVWGMRVHMMNRVTKQTVI